MPYRAAEMFKLVDDVDSYAAFLPWCRDAKVLKRDGPVAEAAIELTRGTVSKTFTTRNTLRQDESIDIALLDGPFRHLAGRWTFQERGEGGCEVALDLEFEFASRLVEMMFGPFFEETCNSLVDAFTRRAEEVYGPR